MEIRSMASFLSYWEAIRERTRRVVRLVPDDAFDWRPAQGRFSFADLVRHLAVFERYVFAENVAGRPSRYPGSGADLAARPEEVLALFERLHEESLEIFRGLDDAALHGRCITPAGATITTWKWLRAMVEHEVHHRGQIYLMLGTIGVAAPPLFGLPSEQVLQNSLPPARS